MAGYLLDTNVISETRRVKANPNVYGVYIIGASE